MVSAGCDLESYRLGGTLYNTFNYKDGGKITPLYYSSDDCDTAYFLFDWAIPDLDPSVDELYRINYCIYGYDKKVYKGITQTTDRFVLLNLITLPLDSNTQFSITVVALLESYKGHTNVISKTVTSLPKSFSKIYVI